MTNFSPLGIAQGTTHACPGTACLHLENFAVIHPARNNLSPSDRVRLTLSCMTLHSCFLPIAGGQMTPDSMQTYLSQHRTALEDELARLGKTRELVLTIRQSAPDMSDCTRTATTGRDWLAARQRRYEIHRATHRADVASGLAIMTDAKVPTLATRVDHHARGTDIAVLGWSDRILELQHRLTWARDRRISAGQPQIDISGPWPPYSFVSIPPLAEQAA